MRFRVISADSRLQYYGLINSRRLRLLILLLLAVITANAVAQERPHSSPLDDTAAFIHLIPAYQNVLASDSFAIALQATITDGRVFDLVFAYNSTDYELLSVLPGPHPSLHILPQDTTADTISIDGFFHPNFTGATTLATLWMRKRTMVDDDTTEIGFLEGQGYSGPPTSPEPVIFYGDTAVVDVEGTPPLAPMELIIIPQFSNARFVADSVYLRWNSVHYDQDGDTIIDPLYLVVFEDRYENYGLIDTVGITPDTFFYDDFIQYYFSPFDSMVVNAGVYRIHTKRTQP